VVDYRYLARETTISNQKIIAYMFCISQGFKGLDICRSIADSTTAALRTGIDDITGFLRL